MTWHKHLLHMFFFVFTIFTMPSFMPKAGAETQSINKSIPAMFVFGDSFVDPGNNNHIGTIFFKSNFPPYGRNFPSGKATGRFTDGSLITDYAASYAGIKQFIPPYLNSSLTIDDLMTGVSFASSGAGLDPLTANLLDISNEGAQKIVVFGQFPLGCLPFAITVYSRDFSKGRGCVESISTVARHFNRKLKRKLKRIVKGSPKVLYADLYTPLIAAIKSPIFGFEVVNRGCCGTGFLETGILCNPVSSVCPNASKYVFWDAIHPTSRTYYIVFSYLIPLIDLIIKL